MQQASLLRGMGVAMLKICQNLFLNSSFLGFTANSSNDADAASFVRRGGGSLRSKSVKNLFYNLFSFYRRFFLFADAATACGRGWGVAALKICQKSFLKSLFFRRGSFCGCRYFVRRRGVAALKILQNLFLNPSYPCFNGVCFFCGCSRLRCCGEGSLRSKSGKNLF